MTACTQQGLAFEGHFSRRVVAEFSCARLSTEGGGCRCAMACSSAAIGNRAARVRSNAHPTTFRENASRTTAR